MSLKEQTRRTIMRYGMIEKGDLVVCGLSGGADSMAMTAVLAQLRDEMGFRLAAAHYSHGLRPGAAEEERNLARDFCAAREIPFFTETGDTREYCRKEALGLEEGARKLRYAFLEQIAAQLGAQKIATAHHLEDHAETVLQNMLRGTGLAGLCGIPPVRGRIIRPILEADRREIEQYLAQNHIPYANDPTNQEQICARNRLRITVLPALREIQAQAESKILEMSDGLRLEEDFLRHETRACFERLAAKEPAGWRLDLAQWGREHPAIGRRVLREACLKAGCPEKELTRRHIAALEQLCQNQSGVRINLPEGILAQKSFDRLFIGKIREKAGFTPVKLTKDHPVFVQKKRISLDEKPKKDDTIIGFSGDEPELHLWVRTRREGDFAQMCGHTKKIKKWMIEQKIPAENRDELPMVCFGDRVLYVCGYPPFETEKEPKHWIIVRRTE